MFKFEHLSNNKGEIVQYEYRKGKYKPMRLMGVTLFPGQLFYGIYSSDFVGDIRLNYVDNNIKREHTGFWTRNLDRIKIGK